MKIISFEVRDVRPATRDFDGLEACVVMQTSIGTRAIHCRVPHGASQLDFVKDAFTRMHRMPEVRLGLVVLDPGDIFPPGGGKTLPITAA